MEEDAGRTSGGTKVMMVDLSKEEITNEYEYALGFTRIFFFF